MSDYRLLFVTFENGETLITRLDDDSTLVKNNFKLSMGFNVPDNSKWPAAPSKNVLIANGSRFVNFKPLGTANHSKYLFVLASYTRQG